MPAHPTTLDEAARFIIAQLGNEDKAALRSMGREDLPAQHLLGLGLFIRNALLHPMGTQRFNRLAAAIIAAVPPGKVPLAPEPDQISAIITERVWEILVEGR